MKLKEIANSIKNLKSALIFCHVNPDGDTLSCAFSLKYALNKLGIPSTVVTSDGVPAKYALLGLFNDFITEPSGEYDACISVDCATESQIGAPYAFYRQYKNTFNIDHHVSNALYAKYNFVENKGACALIIYKLILELGVEIDQTLAKTLMVGIITDTGNFSHSNTDAEALGVACELAKSGADVSDLNLKLFNSQPKARALLYLDVMRGMKFFHNDKMALITITKEQLERYGLTKSDTEGFIDFPMTIGSVQVAVSVFESGDKAYRISFRSKGVNVNEVASTFGGGGHVRASGAMIKGFYEDVVDKLVFTVGNYLD